ncbi:glycoside hydrolase family 1 protein [Atractiella rhizophila]|nr:glycoside hydrolase family 1 protein [Atractiella rhizophila]
MNAMNRLSLLALTIVHLAKALPQFQTPVATDGIIPSLSDYTPPTASSASFPEPTGNPYSQDRLDALWDAVEGAGIPVEVHPINSVQPVKDFEVPDTPTLPTSLHDHAPKDLKFPKGFLFGVASAAQQVEGAVKAEGRGPSHWDYLCHVYPSACTNYTSDVTDLQYYLYKQDIARIKAMGVNAYSFSISWSRVFPFGKKDSPLNEAGLQYYENLVDELLANGIKPVATLFHWDTPLNLVFEYGGFINNNGTVVEDFTAYAEAVFKRLGNKVTTWFTFNEPRVYCSMYGGPPFSQTSYGGKWNSTTAPYPCTYNVLKAHGHAVAAYRQLVKDGTIKAGEISFKNDDSHPVPWDSSNPADQEAADRHFAFQIGIFSEPVYASCDYPGVVLDTIPADILPRLSDEDKKYICKSADFYAIDGYRTNVAKEVPGGIDACKHNLTNPAWPICQDTSNNGQYTLKNGFSLGTPADPFANWLYNTAPFVRQQFKSLNSSFPSPKIYLTEFGFAREFEYQRQELYQITWDSDRTAYFNDYLTEVLLAIHEDGLNIGGTFAWSLVDNFEWNSGLQQRFGLQYVNYSSPTIERHYKLSFLSMRDFFKNHL